MANKLPVIGEKDWQTESDLRTLCEAEEIRKDAKRMKAVREMAKEKMTKMGAIASKTEE